MPQGLPAGWPNPRAAAGPAALADPDPLSVARTADTADAAMPVRVDVIGTLTVSCNGRCASGRALGGRRAHVALAALALAGAPVTADWLASVIWPEQPPATWPAALRGVIRSLRAALAAIGAGGQTVIATSPAGYSLAPGVEVDLHACEVALRSAASLAGQGRHDAVVRAAGPLAKLSGEHLLPGEDVSWLDPYRAQADATALRALELLAQSAAALGEYHLAIEAGQRAVARGPLDERAHRILIRALRDGGDRSAAIRAYEACRAVLADQLGVDPDPQTVQAYLSVLGDPAASGAPRVPPVTTTFFGRDTESAALAGMLREPGLVTVTGKGGAGKSRIAIEVAGSVALGGGIFWISLGPVTRDELVASTAATAIGLPVGTGDATALLAAHLAPLGRVLLVLDGCEVVVDGAASLVTSLLGLCPMLSVLVTSRMPLTVEGERIITVDPLPASMQVRMLADRVRGGGGELVVDEATAPFVQELCRRCGGLPLALELAAAQLADLSLPDLLDHLPALIAGGQDWVRGVALSSYDLLDEDEASVFRCFGIFGGPVPLPMVRAVASSEAIAPVRVVRILRELTARGLLAVDRSGPRWRYYQDDALHGLASELLEAAGEAGMAWERLADEVSAILPDDPVAAPEPYLDAVGEALPAIRSVLSAATDGRLARDRGLELAFRMHRCWAATNVSEGRFWLSKLIAAGSAESPGPSAESPGPVAGSTPAPSPVAASVSPRPRPWVAYATYALGYLSYWSGDTVAAASELRTAVDLLSGWPDTFSARALIYLGGLADDLDRGDEALDFVRRSIEAASPFGVDLQVGAAIGMGCVLAERADPQAAGYAVQAIERCQAGGSAAQLAATLPTAAMICWQVGDLVTARRYVAQAMPLLAGSRRIARVVLLSAAAGIALADGDLGAAIELGTSADAEGTDLGIERELPLARCILARALLAAGDVQAAAGAALRAIDAAAALTFGFPMATCLETAALVALHRPEGSRVAGPLLAAATVIRRRGSRPGPVTLAAAVERARVAVAGAASVAADPGAAVRLASEFLSGQEPVTSR